MNKRERTLAKLAKRYGFSLEQARRSGHFKILDDEGNVVVTVSGSPSCPRFLKNVEADLRRHARP